MGQLNVKQPKVKIKELEVPEDIFVKERLMKYHGVNNDKDLKLALYREWLRKNRNSRS